MQNHFNPSKLFQPWLQREQSKRDAEKHNQKNKRKWRGRRETSVKMGHGGTLDPMATGVLILGVGSGTKDLGHFSTECTKSYEAVVLFGAATDTYDTEGKVVGRKPYEHITKDMVEEALVKFRGKGMQRPPIFSALRVQGKRLYEYAREGKEVPVEIKERPVEVSELEVVEWMEGGTHKWHWPEREADTEEKKFAEKALKLEGQDELKVKDEVKAEDDVATAGAAKRKREADATGHPETGLVEPEQKRSKEEDPTTEPPAKIEEVQNAKDDGKEAQPESADTTTPAATERPPCPAPACRIRMTVTSGFYVRSLCQDLGAAVGSLGMMTDLVRTRQSNFELGTNVLWYDELKQGEDVWGPKVKKLLEEWQEHKAAK